MKLHYFNSVLNHQVPGSDQNELEHQWQTYDPRETDHDEISHHCQIVIVSIT